MPYLVDTNILVDFMRGSAGAADYLDGFSGGFAISAITALELIGGARSQREAVAAKNRKHFRMIAGLRLEVPEY